MADFNGLTKQQEDEMIERIMQDKPWEGFFNRAWFRFFRNHMLKITLLFYIPVMNKIIPEYSTLIIGILFILATAIEYRTKKIEDKITDRQWVEVAVRGGVIGNPPEYKYISDKKRIIGFLNYHKLIIMLNVIGFLLIGCIDYFSLIIYKDIKSVILLCISLIDIFYISYPTIGFVCNNIFYEMASNYFISHYICSYTLKSNNIFYNLIIIICGRFFSGLLTLLIFGMLIMGIYEPSYYEVGSHIGFFIALICAFNIHKCWNFTTSQTHNFYSE